MGIEVHEEWRRLQWLYGEMSDEELLRLAKDKAGLTTVAQQVVDAEMQTRGLVLAEEESVGAPMPELAAAKDDPTLVELKTFQIAMEAWTALRMLDDHGIPVKMEPAMTRMVEGGPLVKTNWLTIFVERTRQEEAVVVLRAKMGLFPVLAVEEMDEDEDGGQEELFMVGEFDVEADAEVAKTALTEAGVWFVAERITEEDVHVTMVEVRMGDLERALAVVETAFGEDG